MPQPDRATSVLVVSFDAGHGWSEHLGRLVSDGDADVKPLDALGVSSWQDRDGIQRELMRLTTD